MNACKKARLLTGMTLEKTSKTTGGPVQTLCRWESGRSKPPPYVRRWYLKELEEIGLSK